MSDGPLDPHDPRFEGDPAGPVARRRELVPSRGPGAREPGPAERVLRVAFPALAVAGLAVIGMVFFRGLAPGTSVEVLGPAEEVRAAVADRPRRVCLRGDAPCAWVTVVEGRVLALSTSGPLPQELGRLGVGWCSSSGRFGANTTGSRWDAAGNVVAGPAPRGLDRYTVAVTREGDLAIHFASLSAGLADWVATDLVPASGPECDRVPFDRDPDLRLPP